MKTLHVLLLLVALGIGLRLPSFQHRLLSDDEAIYAATADAMANGSRLYADVVDHKPPGIYWVYRAGFAAFGDRNTQGAHFLLLLSVLLTAWFLLRTTATAWGDSRTGVIAAGLWLVFSTTWHDYDALAANCELFLVSLHAAAALWLIRLDTKASLRFMAQVFAIGVLVGLSALFKYQGLTWLGVVGVWAVHSAYRKHLSWAWAAFSVVSAVLGAASIFAGYRMFALQDGSAAATLYWFKYNFHYVNGGLSGADALYRGLQRLALIGGVAVVVYGFGIFMAVRGAVNLVQGRLSSVHAKATVLGTAWLLTQIIGVCAGGRFFGHYFHLVLPPLALLAAPACRSAWDKGGSWRPALVLATALPALIFLCLHSVARDWLLSKDDPEPPYEAVAARIQANTVTTDRMFVWGNSPQLYILADRTMGTRFSFCNYMTGENPGAPPDLNRAKAAVNSWAPSWDLLMNDLQNRRPRLLVDAAAGNFDGYGKYPMAAYPRLRAYVDANYRRLEDVAGVVLYQRRESNTSR